MNKSTISDLVYSPNGKQIAIGSHNGTVTILTDPDHVETTLNNFGGPVFSLGYSPDGKTLTVGGNGAAWSWDISKENLYVLDYYPFPESQVVSLDYSSDGKLLAFGLDDGTIWLYRFKDATPLARFNGHNDKVLHVAFSPDGHYLASGAKDGNVILWGISGTISIIKLLEIDHPDWITGLEFSPDSTCLATTSLGLAESGTGVYLWSVPEGYLLDRILNDDLFTTSSLAFSPDGQSLAIGSINGSVKLWQIPHTKRSSQGR